MVDVYRATRTANSRRFTIGQLEREYPDDSGADQFMIFDSWEVDYIWLPKELGGQRERVEELTKAECPKCGCDVRKYVAETVVVFECSCTGFMWCAKPASNEED